MQFLHVAPIQGCVVVRLGAIKHLFRARIGVDDLLLVSGGYNAILQSDKKTAGAPA